MAFQIGREAQGYCERDALFFKQIYSINWAKEKVTVHVAMYFM